MSRMPAFVLVGLLAAGCSGGDEPAQVLPTLTAPAASVTATAAPTTSAAGTTEASVTSAVRHWYDVLNTAASTGDTAELKTLGAPGCKACAAFANSIDSFYAKGRIDGGQFTVKDAVAPAPGAQTSVTAFVQYSVTATRFLDRAGKVTRTVAALPLVNVDMQMLRRGTGWAVQEITQR